MFISPVFKNRSSVQDVNWARAGLGLPLLEEAVERKPGAIPVGQKYYAANTQRAFT